MKGIILFVLFFGAQAATCQPITFLKRYGNNGYDFGRDVKQTPDTGYICTGSSTSFTSDNADAFLMKVDSMGVFKWSCNYGSEGTEWGEAVVNTIEGGYALGGYSNSDGLGGFDFYFAKTSNTGVLLMEQHYGGSDWDKAYDMIAMPDSGFILVGETQSFTNGLRDAYIIRIDKFGDVDWAQNFGGASDDYLNAVILDGDSIVAVGGTESFGSGGTDGLILKYHIDGTFGWMQAVGQDNEDYFTSIDAYNNYYVLGGARSYDYANTKEDMWAYKISNDGNTNVWDKIYGGSAEKDVTMDIMIRDLNEDIYVAGHTETWGYLDGFGDIIYSKFSSGFFFVTTDTYGEAGKDIPFAIEETFDGGFISIADFEYESTGGGSFLLMKNLPSWDWFDIYTEILNENMTTAAPIYNSQELSISPTLVDSYIQIETSQIVGDITIYSLDGKVVKNYRNKKNIEISELQSGTYILVVEIDQQFYSQKFVKI